MNRRFLIGLLAIALIAVTAVTVQPTRTTEAGQVGIPGGWTVDVTYCTNGFTATANVPAGITAGVTHSARVVSANPNAWLLGGQITSFFSASGAGDFSVGRNFYWETPLAAGTAVSVTVNRYEDGLFVAGGTDADTVSNCELPPPGPELTESIEFDGRLNKDYHQTGAVYCRNDGIEVLYSIDGDPREGSQALFVSYDTIAATGIPESSVVLGSTEDGYALYRYADGSYELIAPGLEAGTLYRYRWFGC
jgi:hypothetical protein